MNLEEFLFIAVVSASVALVVNAIFFIVRWRLEFKEWPWQSLI